MKGVRVIEVDETGTEPEQTGVLRADLIRVPIRTATLAPATRTNSYVVGHGGQWLVVDVGGDGSHESLGPLFRAIDQHCGGRVDGVLVTHDHPDHHPGLSALVHRYPKAVAYAHPKVVASISSIHPTVEWVEVDDGDELMGLRLMLTEGHARGHLSAVGGDYVLVGDMMSGKGTIVVAPPHGDMSAYMDSLERLAALGDLACLPAHGGAAPSVRARARVYIEHRLAREQKIYEVLEDRSLLSLDEVTARAYDDVPVAVHLLAKHSALAHLQKLVKDGRVAAESEGWYRCR